jgi:predicted enzyme related to lactoylglutathione lyase
LADAVIGSGHENGLFCDFRVGNRDPDASRNPTLVPIALDFRACADLCEEMTSPLQIVHLELHTPDVGRARAFCAKLCCWRTEQIEHASGSYHALRLGENLGGGLVECSTPRAVWLPYVEVARIDTATELACRLGASVLLEPHEGPAGWRSVIATPEVGEIALWQQKAWRL